MNRTDSETLQMLTTPLQSGQMPPRKRMRTEPPLQNFSTNPQYAPPYEPDAQAWTPQPPPGFYSANPDLWMQQGCFTPLVAYSGLHTPAYMLLLYWTC